MNKVEARAKAKAERSAEEKEVLAEIAEVRQVLINSNGFTDLMKPLSTRMTFDLLAEMFVITRRAYEARIDEIEQRLLAEVQSRGIAYDGVWDKAKDYRPGTFVTHAGAMWCAKLQSTGAKPGDGGLCWQLAVKAGKDAR